MTSTLLSRDAQVVAYCLFGFGPPTSLTFARPHIITPRALAALDELAAAGLITPMDPNLLPRGSRGWKATDKIGRPMRDFAAPTDEDSFPITTS